MKIRLNYKPGTLSFLLCIIATVAVTVLARAMDNQYWASPIIAWVIMGAFGHIQPGKQTNTFYWLYFIFVLGSLGLLILTNEAVYWTSPMLLGVLGNIFALEHIQNIELPAITLTREDLFQLGDDGELYSNQEKPKRQE